MGCGIMNCIRDGKDSGLISSGNQKIDTISDFKITEGMLVQQAVGNPEDNYDNIRTLGEGAFGLVYLGKHKISGVERAIKNINKDRANLSKEEEKTLIREINILKTLDHPNIMKVYEYFNNPNCFSIVSELCTGGELFKKIEDNHLSENVGKYVMKQLLSAVAFCHKNGIIHRDLKPENILLEEEEEAKKEYFTIKVIDFGTSGKIKKGQKYNDVIGTPFYIAPEVLKNKYDEKCDLWSCGVILYVMLCGEPPFYGEDDDEIYNQILTTEVKFYQKEWENISDDAKDLIKKCFIYNSNKRISAKEALNHNFFKSGINKYNLFNDDLIDDTINVLNILREYPKYNIITQFFIAFITHNFIDKLYMNKIKKVFFLINKSLDGQIKIEELINAYKMANINIKKNDIIKIFKSMDSTIINNSIEYEEFLRAGIDKKLIFTEEHIKLGFEMIDFQKKGKINVYEIKQIFGIDDNVDKSVVDNLLKEINKKENEEISYEEFKKILNF
jgi:calcium-dependent protein kinase